jgi:hypothetical protein
VSHRHAVRQIEEAIPLRSMEGNKGQ